MKNCEYAPGIRDVSKRFGGIVAIDHVNIKVRQGQIFGIIGPNGARKTTLLNMVIGIYKPMEGDIMLYGRSIAGRLPCEIIRNGIVGTFQNIRLSGDLNVYENVHTVYQRNMTYNFWEGVIKNRKCKGEKGICANRCEETLEDMRLWEIRGHLAGNLPYGMQRGPEVMRALATSLRILLLDEPAAGMNKDEPAILVGIIREMTRKNRETTILVIGHHMDMIISACNEMTVINSGRQLAIGGPEEIQGNREVIDAYLGAGN